MTLPTRRGGKFEIERKEVAVSGVSFSGRGSFQKMQFATVPDPEDEKMSA